MLGSQTLRGLISEYRDENGDDLLSKLPQMKLDSSKIKNMMPSLLENAVSRNEIPTAHISDRVLQLPIDLLRYELLTTQSSVPEETIAEIIDEIFLPLVTMEVKT
jgi:hypothetical protein